MESFFLLWRFLPLIAIVTSFISSIANGAVFGEALAVPAMVIFLSPIVWLPIVFISEIFQISKKQGTSKLKLLVYAFSDFENLKDSYLIVVRVMSLFVIGMAFFKPIGLD